MSAKQHEGSYGHILKYAGLFGGVQGLGILVGLVRNKCVALLLGPDGMGLVSLFNSTSTLVSNSTNFGLPMSAVRTVSEEYGRGNGDGIARSVAIVRLWSLAAAILGVVACALLSPLLSWFTFSWDGHTLHFLLLSPVVGLMAITGCELAILKAMRRMRSLVTISLVNMVVSLALSIPLYYFFRIRGIVPTLVLLALSQMLVTVAYSYKVCPPTWRVSRKLWCDGYDMVKLGVAFVVAGIMNSCCEFLIRSYLNNVAQIGMVGLYNAGFMISMTYVGLVFSAMETDYFPRLSSVNNLGVTFRTMVNRQVEVMLLLVSPLLVAFMVSLPVLVPLLFSGKFVPIIDMVRVVILAMYFRALKLPVQYIPLAKGDSRSYMFLEVVSECFMLAGVVLLFSQYGLVGAGWGLFLASLGDLIVTFAYARWRYGYHLSGRVLVFAAMQLPLGMLAFVATSQTKGVVYWALGMVVLVVSGVYSFVQLRNARKRNAKG